MSKKITKRDRYAEMREILKDIGREDLVGFIDHEVELLDKKNAGKSKVSQAEQEKRTAIAEAVLGILADEGNPIPNKEIAKAMPSEFGVITTQKLTPILTKLVGEGVITKAVVKGQSVYALA
jgi:hypothetical protein